MATKAKAKTVNYTNEQTSELVKAYSAATNQGERDNVVSQFATKFSKPKASIVAKLSREGVYVAKEYKTKQGEKPQAKADLVELIAARIGVASESLSSLEAATKGALLTVFAALPAKEFQAENEAEANPV